MNRFKPSLVYLIFTFGLLVSALAYASSQILTYFKTGADLNNFIILDTESVNDYYQPKIQWAPLKNEGRSMEAESLVKISKDYLASYYHQYHAVKTGQTKGLKDYFTEKARKNIVKLAQSQPNEDAIISSTSIVHQAKLDFYSDDGTLVTLTDQVISYSQISRNGEYVFANYDTSLFSVMLLLEDNFWRIRHKVRNDKIETDSLDISTKESGNRPLDSLRIKGINYYPKEHPWIKMWESFDSIDFKSDFQKISEAGFNTIRIFVPYDHFGRANVPGSELEKLTKLMDVAQGENLKVIVTLFDFFLGYQVEEWTLSDRHAEQVVNQIDDHPALLAWDVKNEPDLDFENMGKEVVKEWLSFIIRRIQSYDPSTPVTIGWSSPFEITTLANEVDFHSFHYYLNPSDLRAILDSTRIDKPLFMGEVGSHSFNAWWFPFKKNEKDQSAYIQEITEVINEYQLHYAFWTLYDFERVPNNVAGKWLWEKGPQKNFGFIRTDDSPKPAYQLIKKFNSTVNEK